MKNLLCLFIFCLASCVEDYQNHPLKIADIISFGAGANLTVPADGTSSIEIEIKLGPLVTDEQEVTFNTDQGSFQGTGGSSAKQSIAVTTINKEAHVTLIPDLQPNPRVGIIASIVADSKTYSNTIYAEFKAARPSQIFLSSDVNSLRPDQISKATLILYASRENGKVSSGLVVNISVTGTDGLEVDAVPFITTVSDPSENPVTFTIKSLNDKPGRATVTVTTTKDDGNTISASKDITFSN